MLALHNCIRYILRAGLIRSGLQFEIGDFIDILSAGDAKSTCLAHLDSILIADSRVNVGRIVPADQPALVIICVLHSLHRRRQQPGDAELPPDTEPVPSPQALFSYSA